jgi:hypothetical protein
LPNIDVGVLGQDGLAALVVVHPVTRRRDRGADELGADGGRVGVVEVELEVARHAAVQVAGDGQRVADPAVADAAQDAIARRRVAVPRVHRDRLPLSGPRVELHHRRLLGHRVPAGTRGGHPVEQPLLLAVTGDRPRRFLLLGVGRLGTVAGGLVGAVLAGVQHADLCEVAEGEAPVELHVGPDRLPGHTQRHVLPVGAQGVGPEHAERLPRCLARRSGTSSAQLFSTSWSSRATIHGKLACASCGSASLL